VLEPLPDGSYRSQIRAATDRRRGVAPTPVRVIQYTLGKDPGRPAQSAPYRLLTTILDPAAAPAAELAALYHERWEFEGLLDELKTHQRGPRVVLRSQRPDMVEQEVYAYLLVHLAIRRLMHQAAVDGQPLDPDQLSFVRSLRVVRRQVTAQAAFPPERLATAIDHTIAEIRRHLVKRRQRANPGVVKRKMSNFGVKRAKHTAWPQPTRPVDQATVIVAASKPAPIPRRRTTNAQLNGSVPCTANP
jgi:hypothetical protein